MFTRGLVLGRTKTINEIIIIFAVTGEININDCRIPTDLPLLYSFLSRTFSSIVVVVGWIFDRFGGQFRLVV